MQEVCYYHIPGATWICRGYHSEGYVEPPNPGPVDPPNPPTNPPVNFEELWAILSGVSDGKVTIEDYKQVAHLIWPNASDIEIQLHFSTHDLNDDGIVEEHEAKEVLVHTSLLDDAIFLARELWDRIDSNDNNMIDFDELVDIYDLAYTLDFTEEDLKIEELTMVYGMFVAVVGEPTKENLLKLIREEMIKASQTTVEAAR